MRVEYRVHHGHKTRQGSFVESCGALAVPYNEDGACRIVINAWRLRPQPGNSGDEYVANAIGTANPGVGFTGVVTGEPLNLRNTGL